MFVKALLELMQLEPKQTEDIGVMVQWLDNSRLEVTGRGKAEANSEGTTLSALLELMPG